MSGDTSRFEGGWVQWPVACVGCGTTEGLQDASQTLHEMEQTRSMPTGVVIKTVKVTTYTMDVQLRMYLCERCREMGRFERRARKSAGDVASFVTVLFAFVLPIVALRYFLRVAMTSWDFPMLYGLALAATAWAPLYIVSHADKFKGRHDSESYYDHTISPKNHLFALRLRNEVFYRKFIELNPTLVSTTSLHPNLLINSHRGSSFCISVCSGIVLLGLVLLGVRAGNVAWIPVFTLPALIALFLGLIVREVVYRSLEDYKRFKEIKKTR